MVISKYGLLAAIFTLGMVSCKGKHKCTCSDVNTGEEVFDSGPKLSKEDAANSCIDYAEDPEISCVLWEGWK